MTKFSTLKRPHRLKTPAETPSQPRVFNAFQSAETPSRAFMESLKHPHRVPLKHPHIQITSSYNLHVVVTPDLWKTLRYDYGKAKFGPQRGLTSILKKGARATALSP